jgi:hypothetical protein
MNHHHLEEFAIEEDKIFHLPHGTLGVKNLYMDRPPISVFSSKGGVTDEENNEYRYSFQINDHTCPVWREIFSRNLQAFPVKFKGNEMSFQCIQPNLDSRYAAVKQAMEKTNSDYAIERGKLIESIKAHQSQKIVREKKRIEAHLQAKDGFEKLEL